MDIKKNVTLEERFKDLLKTATLPNMSNMNMFASLLSTNLKLGNPEVSKFNFPTNIPNMSNVSNINSSLISLLSNPSLINCLKNKSIDTKEDLSNININKNLPNTQLASLLNFNNSDKNIGAGEANNKNILLGNKRISPFSPFSSYSDKNLNKSIKTVNNISFKTDSIPSYLNNDQQSKQDKTIYNNNGIQNPIINNNINILNNFNDKVKVEISLPLKTTTTQDTKESDPKQNNAGNKLNSKTIFKKLENQIKKEKSESNTEITNSKIIKEESKNFKHFLVSKHFNFDENNENEDFKKNYRKYLNRKAAKKCRQKKKILIEKLVEENIDLNEKVKAFEEKIKDLEFKLNIRIKKEIL